MKLNKNIKLRIFISFLTRVNGTMIFPFMAIYFTAALGPVTASMMLVTQVAVQFAASIYGGHWADVMGRKKLMMIGEMVKTAAFMGMLLCNTPYWSSAWGTFFMLLLIGISQGLIMPASEAMLIDVSTKEIRSFMYSVNYWATNLAFMIGIAAGGWLYKDYFYELLISLVIMSFLTLWMTGALLTETYRPAAGKKAEAGFRSLWGSYRSVMADTPFLLFTLAGIAILSLEFQRNNFVAVRLEEEIQSAAYFTWLGGGIELDGVKLLSLLTIENTLLIVLLTAAAAKWLQNKSEELYMYVGFILFGLGFGIMCFAADFYLLALSVFILSIGELIYVPTRQSLLADMIDESKRGAYMAFNGFVFQIGKMFGALGIVVGKTVGATGMMLLCFLFALIGCLLARKSLLLKNKVKVVKEMTV
ncbi:MFS transporter [Bacillus lacus]|uniref:MFS transporter n=1 Tax=Metabacillus lacus TaxID=1983721 RepID=A0A7X2IZD2_9BACI|nr:MFS transporter [Metabacillus lacus]MRX72434.1 MFS transporter [Metabacillus lacus]